MPARRSREIKSLKPDLQIAFYERLKTIRGLYLDEALQHAIEVIDMRTLDEELLSVVGAEHLKKIAKYRLRGEVFFSVPCLLRARPSLLGYYRLLYGLSQKEFYNKGPYGRFKRLEDAGTIPAAIEPEVSALCESLVETGKRLIDGISELSISIAHDLQLLTLGPQLRGGRNTKLGQDASRDLFELLERLVGRYAREITSRSIRLENESGRTVLIEFSSDPDVRITEQLASSVRPLVSIEIKGGADGSNIHNRLGEAEKSHLKAKSRGFFEFRTITRVPADESVARRASPTTTHFFHLDQIKSRSTKAHRAFRDVLGSVLGIRG